MEENPEKRDNARIDHQCLVTIENLTAGTINKAKMLNFSATGLYFEADNLMHPGEDIFIGIDNSPFASEQGLYECYRVEIIWRKELRPDSGGAGATRGGLGQYMEVGAREGYEFDFQAMFDRIDHPARGRRGGEIPIDSGGLEVNAGAVDDRRVAVAAGASTATASAS
mgnify:CR=1 FL=1